MDLEGNDGESKKEEEELIPLQSLLFHFNPNKSV
jgi:hypothetical protein